MRLPCLSQWALWHQKMNSHSKSQKCRKLWVFEGERTENVSSQRLAEIGVDCQASWVTLQLEEDGTTIKKYLGHLATEDRIWVREEMNARRAKENLKKDKVRKSRRR